MVHLPRDIELRKLCSCGCARGTVTETGGQDVVRCLACERYQYNAPRTETGRKRRTVQTTHAAIKPKQRSRIIERASSRCERCGKGAGACTLHVGHILSVDIGHRYGIEDELLNDDENLMCLCDECNLGMGAEPMSLRLAVLILRARVSWAKGRK